MRHPARGFSIGAMNMGDSREATRVPEKREHIGKIRVEAVRRWGRTSLRRWLAPRSDTDRTGEWI